MKTKIIASVLSFIFLTGNSFAATGFKDLIQEYQYDVTVVWDQKDKEFIQRADEKLISGVETLIENGASPQELMNEAITLIPDEKVKADIKQTMGLYGQKKFSKEQLVTFLNQNATQMARQGSSWSTVGKILVGVVVTYAVLKLLMIIIMYWDTDPNYGQPSGDYPPK